MIKKDYLAHDEVYKRLRENGCFGWDTEEGCKEFINQLNSFVGTDLLNYGKILELGCGNGSIISQIKSLQNECTGIDISPTAIEWAKDKYGHRGIDFQTGDAVLLTGYPANHYDVLLDGHCYHCIIGEDRQKFIESAGRVLKRGGHLIIMTMCGEVTSETNLKYFHHDTRCFLKSDGVATRYIALEEELRNEIKHSCFELIKEQILVRKEEDDQDLYCALLRKK